MSRSIHAPIRPDRAAMAGRGVRAAAVLFLLTLAGCAWQVAYRTRAEELVRTLPASFDDLPPRRQPRGGLHNIQFARRIDEALLDLESEPHLARADILLLQEMDGSASGSPARGIRLRLPPRPSTRTMGAISAMPS
jgi:hypothetical protein